MKLLKENSNFYSLADCIEEYINSGTSGLVAVYFDNGNLICKEDIFDVTDVIEDNGMHPDELMILEEEMGMDLEEGDDYYTPGADLVLVVV